MSATTRFPARYPGECVWCGARFDEGDDAGYVRGEDGIHCGDCLDDREAELDSQPSTPTVPDLAREETGAGPGRGPRPTEDPSGRPIVDLSVYADDVTARGTDPNLVGAELLDVFRVGVEAHPRSAQKEIGPSGVGDPCDRRLGYFFADVPPAGTEPLPWRQAVGTAVHDHASLWAHQANEKRGTRWLTDVRVYVGELYPGRPVFGNLDFLDITTATIVDLKVPGPTALKRYRRPTEPESPTYRVQVQLYARGVENAGLRPEHVAILRVPMAGELLTDSVFRFEPYRPEVAERALARAGRIAGQAAVLGPAVVNTLPATDAYCHRCPWFRPGSTDLTRGCPGAEGRASRRDPLLDLIA